jgi:hypothetical protein
VPAEAENNQQAGMLLRNVSWHAYAELQLIADIDKTRGEVFLLIFESAVLAETHRGMFHKTCAKQIRRPRKSLERGGKPLSEEDTSTEPLLFSKYYNVHHSIM